MMKKLSLALTLSLLLTSLWSVAQTNVTIVCTHVGESDKPLTDFTIHSDKGGEIAEDAPFKAHLYSRHTDQIRTRIAAFAGDDAKLRNEARYGTYKFLMISDEGPKLFYLSKAAMLEFVVWLQSVKHKEKPYKFLSGLALRLQ